MMGYEEEELRADIQAWVGRLHLEDAVAAQANVQRLLQTPVASFDNEYSVRHEDGTCRWVHYRGSREERSRQPASPNWRHAGRPQKREHVMPSRNVKPELRSSMLRLAACQVR